MGINLELVVGERVVSGAELPYSAEAEIGLLKAIFPESYWGPSHHEEFDFLSNEQRVRRLLEEFRGFVEESLKEGRISKTLAPFHTQSFGERCEFATEFLEELRRIYDTGMSLQKEQKQPRIGIFS